MCLEIRNASPYFAEDGMAALSNSQVPLFLDMVFGLKDLRPGTATSEEALNVLSFNGAR